MGRSRIWVAILPASSVSVGYMNLLELFISDHERLKEMAGQLKDLHGKDQSLIQPLMSSFQKILDRHTYEEETFLYPKAKQSEELRPEALEGWEEHRMIGQLMTEMKALPVSDERWFAKFKVMSETLLHHLEEEEEELFPMSKKELDSSVLVELAEKALKSRSASGVE